MKIKYRSGYAEGGFLDDGASVDPVSGNEVPTGSLAEEVRDDVPAQLSEGEFVVPADVVRYIGLEKLMQMRDQAKSGLAEMEQEGQMGGSPAPAPEMQMQPEMSGGMEDIDIDAMIDGMEDGGVQNFDEGGFVQRDDGSWQYAGPTEADGFEGANYSDLMGSNFGTVPTTETMTYINEEGYKIYIPIIDGKPAYQPPEGFTLFNDSSKEDGGVVDTVDNSEQDLAEAMQVSTTNNQAAQDFAQNGGREEQEKNIASSARLGRSRLQDFKSQATSDMTQKSIDRMWSQMTQQEKSIYEDRMKDPKFLDGVLIPDDTAPVDRMLLAIQTAETINERKGLILNKSQSSTYSDEPVDFKKMAKVIGSALIKGIPGLLTAAKVGELGVDSTEVLAAAKEFVLSGIGQGSGRTGDEGTQPPASTPTEYNQAYWKENFYDKGLGKDSAAIGAEQLRIAMETGKNAYGNELTQSEVEEVNRLRIQKDAKDKQDRTIFERQQKVKEAAIQVELDRKNQEANDKQDTKLARVAREEAVRKAAEDAATQQLLKDQNRMQQRSTVNSGGDDRGKRQRDAEAGNGFGQGDANKKSEEGGQTDYGYYNYGGLATKNKPEVMKMRKDPTSGLAAKKKSKQKAQAKKGALAAKRT